MASVPDVPRQPRSASALSASQRLCASHVPSDRPPEGTWTTKGSGILFSRRAAEARSEERINPRWNCAIQLSSNSDIGPNSVCPNTRSVSPWLPWGVLRINDLPIQGKSLAWPNMKPGFQRSPSCPREVFLPNPRLKLFDQCREIMRFQHLDGSESVLYFDNS